MSSLTRSTTPFGLSLRRAHPDACRVRPFAGPRGVDAWRLRLPCGLSVLPGTGLLIAAPATTACFYKFPGELSVITGNGRRVRRDIVPATLSLNGQLAVARSVKVDILMADTGNNRVKIIRADRSIETVARTGV